MVRGGRKDRLVVARAAAAASGPADALLDVRDLHVRFDTVDGVVHAVRGGQLPGAARAGRSASWASRGRARACRPDPARPGPGGRRQRRGLVRGARPAGHARRAAARDPGQRISMVFQDPLTSLHPLYKLGWQIEETIRAHDSVSRRAARRQRHRPAGPGRHPAPGRAGRRLPAPVLRRHAAAGHDRHGAGAEPAADHRRRADHRPGRHRPGPDPRPAAPAAAASWARRWS